MTKITKWKLPEANDFDSQLLDCEPFENSSFIIHHSSFIIFMSNSPALSATNTLNDTRTMNGWAFFDCANSSYSLVISSAVFPAYFAATAPETIPFLGMEIPSSAILAYAVTMAYMVIAISSPILSGIADYGGKRKMFMTADRKSVV